MSAENEAAEKFLSGLFKTPDNPSRMGRTNSRLIPDNATIHTRLVDDIEVPDVESMPATFLLTAIMHLAKNAGRLEKKIADTSRLVDEYVPNPGQYAILQGTSLEVFSQFDQIPERITSILITGPAGDVTVQLGDRVWNFTIPASKYLVIAPVSILLTRQDRRLLTPTSVASGNYTMELMGYADERFVS